ncbi:hypothetical protein TNCV_4399721 [Trichonephila clavipes]|nr:hypothetical protein TNCV_4399721 [Trichonephila clavipes]
MTSHNHLVDSLKCRAVGKVEAGQSQLEVARSLHVALKGSLGSVELIPNKLYCHQNGWPRWTTAPQLARDLDAVPGSIPRQALYSRLPKIVLYVRHLV